MTLSADSPCHVSLPQPSPHPPPHNSGLCSHNSGLCSHNSRTCSYNSGTCSHNSGTCSLPLFPHSACRLPMPSERSQKAAGHSLRHVGRASIFCCPQFVQDRKTKTWYSHTLFHKNPVHLSGVPRLASIPATGSFGKPPNDCFMFLNLIQNGKDNRAYRCPLHPL